MQTVVDGILTQYQVVNPRSSKTILFLPGWGQNGSLWLPVVNQLNPDFKYILLDLPGFGQTQLLPSPATLPDYANFVLSFMAKQKISQPAIFGHSFGGQIAAYLAIHRPRSLSALILLSPAIDRRRSLKQKAKICLYHHFSFLKSLLPPAILKRLLSLVSSTDYYNSSPTHRQVLKNIVNFDLTGQLNLINTPSFLLWGENDTEIAYSGQTIANLIPNCRLYLLHQSDHSPHLSSPKTFIPAFNHLTHLLP